jgi:formylglycine-generating enzyme required for sulfatase activity
MNRPIVISAVLAVWVVAWAGCQKSEDRGSAEKQPAGPNPAVVASMNTTSSAPRSSDPPAQATSQPASSHDIELDLGGGVTMKLVLIPAGKFVMGSPDREDDRSADEAQHEVTISQPFYMGTYLVTQEQWKAVMGSEPWKGRSFAHEGKDLAASYISGQDAIAFCEKLSAKTGRPARLPTEAQWEYACRAGSTTRFCYGDDKDYIKLGDYAWFDKNGAGIGEKYAHAVGQKLPNSWGLYDMHGNVFQWCSDWYGDYPGKPAIDPAGADPQASWYQVQRGGSFDHSARYCRSAARKWSTPDLVWQCQGLRVVVEVARVRGK